MRLFKTRMNNYYTYAYLREDRTPYYIGKGKGNRAYRRRKNDTKSPKDKSRIIFLKQNLTEEEAFKHEIYMIAVFGRKDLGTGILHNRTDGGEGPSGVIKNEETKKKMSKVKRGKKWWNDGKGNSKMSVECPGTGWVLGVSEDFKKKMSIFHTGKKYWNDGNGNMKKSVECPGDGWVRGVSEEHKKNVSLSHKGKNKGMRWWNDGCGNSKRAVECPGTGWIHGMGKKLYG